MKECADDDAHFSYASSNEALDRIFRSIGDISKENTLRLSE